MSNVLAWTALTAVGNDYSWVDNLGKGTDTSKDRKARKNRARMLTMQRQAELRANPKPPKRKRHRK